MTSDRPILFSGPMVRAILESRKTQTRRVVKMRVCGGRMIEVPADDDAAWVQSVAHNPYGKPGDRLWVRETWGLFSDFGFCDTTCAGLASLPEDWHLAYRADHINLRHGDGPHQPVWRPSIHMPRWASRLTLEITNIRVERLQEISRADAIAEGIERVGGEFSYHHWRNYLLKPFAHPTGHCSSCQRSYMTLWESINGIGSWAANPWVWVVTFRVLPRQGGEVKHD